MANASTLHDSEWRQGTIVPHSLVEHLPPTVGADDLLILISHDCDIVNPSYEQEPYVEYVLARKVPVESKDGRLFHGKNPRRLQLWLDKTAIGAFTNSAFTIEAPLDRRSLEKGAPDKDCVLSSPVTDLIARWIAKRYCRPSFPSAFNDRVRTVANKIEKAMKRLGEDVTGVFIAFLNSDGELSDTDPYEIDVRVVTPPDAASDEERERIALKLVAELNELFGQCSGIAAEVTLVSEAEFSLEDCRNIPSVGLRVHSVFLPRTTITPISRLTDVSDC